MKFSEDVWRLLSDLGWTYAKVATWLKKHPEHTITKTDFNSLSSQDGDVETFVSGCRLFRTLWEENAPSGSAFSFTYADLCRTDSQRKYLIANFPFADEVVRDEVWEQRQEQYLKRFCENQVKLWESMRTGADKRNDFSRYVSPRFSRRIDRRPPSTTPGTRADELNPFSNRYESMSDARDGEDKKFAPLFRLGTRILVHDDAGGGKSTFTRAAVAWLSRETTWALPDFLDRKPCLAIRWEGNILPWPSRLPGEDAVQAYQREIAARVVSSLRCPEEHAKSLVRYAWENGRVILLLDAYDQSADENGLTPVATFHQLANWEPSTATEKDIRILVTSRPQAALEEPYFTNSERAAAWSKAHLEGFEPWQQLQFLKPEVATALGEKWKAEFETKLLNSEDQEIKDEDLNKFATNAFRNHRVYGEVYVQVDELLRTPVILQFVREMAGKSGETEFPKFVNRAHLYWQATNKLIRRNVGFARGQNVVHDPEENMAILRQLLSACAIHMLFADSRGYSTARIADLKKSAQRSFRDVVLDASAWEKCWTNLQKLAGLTNHALVEEISDQRFGWKHRGVMEFYAGLFLARYATKDEQERLSQHAANPAWFWVFRFAMEQTQFPDLSGATFDGKTLVRSLAPLFGSVPQVDPHAEVERIERRRNGQSSDDRTFDWRRPTQLMYDAYCLLRTKEELLREDRHVPEWGVCGVLAEVSNSILEDFAKDFEQLRDQGSDKERAIAQQLTIMGRWTPDGHKDSIASFVDCPPDEVSAPFLMGGTKYPEEKPLHWVRVTPFRLQSTVVTQAQFALFDPACLSVGCGDEQYWRMGDNYPAIYTSYYDAVMFCRWVGARLPTEAEWEFACRAGTTTEYWFGDEKERLGEFAWYLTNSEVEGKSTAQPVARKNPTCWKSGSGELYDIYGNVWESCGDWYDEHHYREFSDATRETPAVNPCGPEQSPENCRAVRGGSWGGDPGGSLSASRFGVTPADRSGILGFRLARTR